VRRREFIAGLASAVVCPVGVRSQQRTVPRVGFLSGGQESNLRSFDDAFQRGLSEQGYVPGRNVEILHRWAENRYDRLPALAAELAREQVAAIVATAPGTATALAAKSATAPVGTLQA
jgi:putative ABC transport system substrate-binding protein